ncbi:MAG: hypothetical protein RLZZ293_395 [Pseudomonadota bacterium]|jgi:chorismate-pyruvate lyase
MNSIKSALQSEQVLNYPKHDGFEELLNSCGSMTSQLENLGHQLSITLISEIHTEKYFERYISLNLDQVPVILACSRSKISNEFFYTLLKNAHVTPIGKFLFAPHSQVKRLPHMEIKQIDALMLSNLPILKQYLTNKYHSQQQFWLRNSQFSYLTQQLDVIEIILPQVNLFFSTIDILPALKDEDS